MGTILLFKMSKSRGREGRKKKEEKTWKHETGEKLRFLTKMCPPVIISPIYIYICCEVIIWSKFGGFWKLLSGPSWVFGSYYLVQVCVFSL